MTHAPPTTSDLSRPVVRRPGATDVAVRQVRAIDAFHRARHAAEQAAACTASSRETRLDAARRLDVVRRQHATIVERTDAALRNAGDVVARSGSPRAVVAHRDDWFGRTLARALDDQGFRLLARLGNGAEAVGATVAEQPEVLVLEDPLPMMTGQQVVTEVRDYAPHTVVAVHASDPRATARLLQAGADRVFGRQATPADVAQDLGLLLGARPLAAV